MLHWHFSLFMTINTAGITLIFTQAVSRINITVHILKRVTVMNQDTFQHFPPGSTSTPLSHIKPHFTNSLVRHYVQTFADALSYLYVYRISTVCILVTDGEETGVHVYLFTIQQPHVCYFNWAHCGAVG
jgi:hypothetical protein